MYPDESRSLENLHHMRLMALLRDMIDTEGGEKAARRWVSATEPCPGP